MKFYQSSEEKGLNFKENLKITTHTSVVSVVWYQVSKECCIINLNRPEPLHK